MKRPRVIVDEEPMAEGVLRFNVFVADVQMPCGCRDTLWVHQGISEGALIDSICGVRLLRKILVGRAENLAEQYEQGKLGHDCGNSST